MEQIKLNPTHSFLEAYDYLQALANRLKKSEFKESSNLLYEVAYASAYLDNLLLSGKNSEGFTRQIVEFKAIFDAVLETVTLSDLNKMRSGPEYKELLNRRKETRDKSCYGFKTEVKLPVSNYFIRIIPKLTFIFICLFAHFTNAADRMVDVMGRSIIGIVELTEEEVVTLLNVAKILFDGALALISVILILGVVVDLLYIVMPTFRLPLSGRGSLKHNIQLASNTAVKCCSDELCYISVKTYDRAERNMYWLEQLKGLCARQDLPATIGGIPVETYRKAISELEGMLFQSSNTRQYLEFLVKIEYLHDKAIEAELI